ncbi:MAG: hypothetical protein J0I77_01900 [Rudaea sp.]|uniref:hypothetical protein n=1 Tax=unclassified Rudaea TaxID=2627037 RepID=UPI0010F48387|nr:MULTISPECIES: hypothetical protein [unclassified Rudaea]MBN8884448.1 hypothetical protein [Rudaea sp.]
MSKNKQNNKIHNAAMTEDDFKRMAVVAPAAARVQSTPVAGGKTIWRLVGNQGLYHDANGKTDYEDLAELHALLHRCGFTRFHQDGVLKLFFEDPDFANG